MYLLSQVVAIFSKLGATGGLDVAGLGFFEVDNMPDRSKILKTDYVSIPMERN